MKWAGGAGRQDGVHMLHTFEEVRTRTPADPNGGRPGGHHAARGMGGPPP